MDKRSYINDDANNNYMAVTNNPIAEAVKNIGMNNMQIIEIRAYPLSDKIKKIKKHSFKGYTPTEITVLSFSSVKEGYLTINGSLDLPLNKLRIDSTEDEGPWYFTNKDEALQKVREFNKIEYDVTKEAKAETDAAEEYLRNLIENDRF